MTVSRRASLLDRRGARAFGDLLVLLQRLERLRQRLAGAGLLGVKLGDLGLLGVAAACASRSDSRASSSRPRRPSRAWRLSASASSCRAARAGFGARSGGRGSPSGASASLRPGGRRSGPASGARSSGGLAVAGQDRLKRGEALVQAGGLVLVLAEERLQGRVAARWRGRWPGRPPRDRRRCGSAPPCWRRPPERRAPRR